MWPTPVWANLQRNVTVLLTSYMIVFRFCWPELCLFFPLSLRCCLRSVSNWNTWGKKPKYFRPFESIFPGKQKWTMQNPINQTKIMWLLWWRMHQQLNWKMFWHQNDEKVCKLIFNNRFSALVKWYPRAPKEKLPGWIHSTCLCYVLNTVGSYPAALAQSSHLNTSDAWSKMSHKFMALLDLLQEMDL